MRRERPHPLTHGASRYFVGSLPPRGARELRLWFGPRRELRVRKSTARGGRHGNRQKTTGKCQPLAAARAARKRAARRLRAVRRLHARLRREFRTAQDARARPRLQEVEGGPKRNT